ncbi:hypothetical protein AB7008_23640 [Bradyrhizobium sp. 521_C7_N1_3]|uniref:hypothetical protein n=1 Tax=Bradyrhizobium sp. 521_C7_N1_3 TaxID=3240368 RepID=UPI003F88AE81
MEYVRFAVKFTSFAVITLLVGTYFYLIYTGDIPKPDIDNILKQLAPSMTTGGSAIALIMVAMCVLLTAIAPFIYAARSGDFFTVIVSIVAIVLCFVMVVYSRTVIDMVLAAIIYFTSAFVSVVVYSTSRIADALRRREGHCEL